MQPQIVHETEVHRQHVRLKIPIQIEVDGVRYTADDWSVGGFGVESAMTSRQPGEHFAVRMIFPFEEFDMSMRLDARMVYVDQEHGRFGCAFLGLSKEQVAVFRYLVDAYLSGEVVSAGDILQIRSHDSYSRARLPPDFLRAAQGEYGPGKTKRYGLLGLFGVAGLILATLIVLGLRERFFTIDIQSAVIEAPVTELRAPIPGSFLPLLDPGAEVEQGFMLGTIRGLDRSIAPIESPCHCMILDQIGLSGQTYQMGEPLFALIGVNETLMVRAQLALEEAERLEVGDRAEIRVPGRAGPMYGEIVRINVRPRSEALLNTNAEFPISRRLAQVVIRPDRPFELADFGSLVSLRFL